MTKIYSVTKAYVTRYNSAKKTRKAALIAKKAASQKASRKTAKSKRVLKAKTARRVKKGRNRKTYDQMVVLNRCFREDPEWTRDTVQFLKKTLGLKTSQIYKWGYDRKKLAEKESFEEEAASVSSPDNNVFMTDVGIQDYNQAVVNICNSVSKGQAKEVPTRNPAGGALGQESEKLNIVAEEKITAEVTQKYSTHPESFSDVSDIRPSNENDIKNRTENEEVARFVSENIEDDMRLARADCIEGMEKEWDKFQNEDTYNLNPQFFLNPHYYDYNRTTLKPNENEEIGKELEIKPIEIDLSSDEDEGLSFAYDISQLGYEMHFDIG